jgi:hypothetical protein
MNLKSGNAFFKDGFGDIDHEIMDKNPFQTSLF